MQCSIILSWLPATFLIEIHLVSAISGGENLAFLWEAAVEVHPELLSAPADEIGTDGGWSL